MRRARAPCLAAALRDPSATKGISTVFVLVDSARPSAVLGYYSLTAAELGSAALGKADRKKCRAIPYLAFAWDALRVAPT